MFKKLKSYFLKVQKFLKNRNYRSQIMYFFFREFVKIEDKVILYESYHGASISCNPYAMFLFMKNDRRFSGYKHVWILTSPSNVSEERASIVQRGSIQHAYYLVKSKYLINNNSFLPYVSKQKNQIYINTWHGTPIKSLGKDIKGSYAANRNVYRNLLQCDYFLSPNKYTTDKFLASNDVDTIFSGTIIENGYPRNDFMFASSDKKEQLQQLLQLDKNKKTILYAPTFRGSHTSANANTNRYTDLIIRLQEECSEKFNILTKLHHTQSSENLDVATVPHDIETNELLSIVDVLITDYSSIAFDFLALKRPILYYAFDLEEYTKERGLYFDLDEMAGVVCRDEVSIVNELNTIDSFMDFHKKSYEINIDKFASYDDGNVTSKVMDTIFFNKKSSTNNYTITTNSKKKMLIYAGGFLNNGITSSAIALLSKIEYDKFEIYIIFNGHSKEENYLRLLNNISPEVKVLYYVQGRNRLTQMIHQSLFIDNQEKMYQDEYYRIFADTRFDIAIDYSGYGSFWPGVIGYSPCKTKYIYLHSDMKKESKRRAHLANYDLLEFLYHNYFDKLITVSESSFQANIENYPELEDKIAVVNNPINAQNILALSKLDSFDENKTNFINIGRYSTEKGQDRLLKSFKNISMQRDDIHLYLVGHGPLHNKLNALVSRHNLRDKVTITGNLENPFPLLKKCDCFILSSHYEGQGLVLLEALILGVPCVSTDIDGPRSILRDGQGLLVEDSEEGLAFGMSEFIEGRVPFKEFDYKGYSDTAMNEFYAIMD